MLRFYKGDEITDEQLEESIGTDGTLQYEVGPIFAWDLIELEGVGDWNYEFVEQMNSNAYLLSNLDFDLIAEENGEIFVRVTASDTDMFKERGKE